MRPTWVLATGALVVALAALVPFVRRGRTNGGGTPGAGASATVVIGDLGGADSLLALAVREALRAELVNTSGVLVTSDMGIRELKTLMRLPADASLGRPELLA